MIVTFPCHIHLFLFACSPVNLPLGDIKWSMIVTLPCHIHPVLFVVQCFFLLVPWNGYDCDLAWSYSLVFVCL